MSEGIEISMERERKNMTLFAEFHCLVALNEVRLTAFSVDIHNKATLTSCIKLEIIIFDFQKFKRHVTVFNAHSRTLFLRLFL